MSKTKQNPVTEVIFRKYKEGDIIALFPYDTERNLGQCSCYQHVGQHGTADYTGVMQSTKAASPAEYADLKRELENYGPAEANYNLKVLTKMSWNKHRKIFYANKR